MTIKLLIGCRIFLYAQGVKHLLAEDSEIEVIGIATSGRRLQELCSRKPDVILADHAMSRRIFNKGGNDPRVLLVSNGRFPAAHQDLQNLVAKGLAGILPESTDVDTLKQALRAVSSGDLWIACKTLKESLLVEGHAGQDIPLTRREVEILQHLLAGRTNKEIAQKLFVSEQAVKAHFSHLYKKFGVSNRVKLALHAQELLADPFGEP